MLRKIVVSILTLTLFLGIITPSSYGQTKSSILTKTQAEKLAKEKLNIKEDYKLEYSNLHTRDIQERQFWNLEFDGEGRHISLTMAADNGEIISISKWKSEDYNSAVTLLKDEAKEIATDFIKSLERERFKETEEVSVKAPTIIPYYSYRDEQGTDNYYFMFVRKLKDEFFPNNYFTVSVSGISGNIVNYEMKWDEATYQQDKKLLRENEARKLFEKDDRLHLKYVALNKYNPEGNKKVVLTPVYTYLPKESDKIDAITGKLLSYDELYNWDYGNLYRFTANESAKMKQEDMAAGGGLAETIPEEGVISKERAAQMVMGLLKDDVDVENLQLNSTNYTNNFAGLKGKFWSMYWYSKEGDKYINAVVDADSGEVLQVSYNKSGDMQTIEARDIAITEEVISPEQKKVDEKILNLMGQKVEKIFPKTKGQLKLEVEENKNKDKNQVGVTSFRYINDIPFEGNYVKVNIDRETREITSLNYRWYEVDVQQSSLLRSKDAHKAFYDRVGFEKYLVQLKDLDKYEKEGLDLATKELLPVYGVKEFDFSYLDAISGKFLDYSGEEYKENTKAAVIFKDIKDNKYTRDILLMDKMGILKVEDEYFRASDSLLRKDALKWIVEIGWSNKAYGVDRYYGKSDGNKDYFKDISKDNDYYKYIEAGVEFGIIDKGDYFKPNEKITKLELTEWIINAMKQKELARYSAIFQAPYKDKELIKPDHVGYVALAKYYNIFNDKNIEGRFQPDINLKRGEFVHYMYEFIKNYKNVAK